MPVFCYSLVHTRQCWSRVNSCILPGMACCQISVEEKGNNEPTVCHLPAFSAAPALLYDRVEGVLVRVTFPVCVGESDWIGTGVVSGACRHTIQTQSPDAQVPAHRGNIIVYQRILVL